MSGTRLIPRQPDNAAHSPPSRNLRDEGISRAKPLASKNQIAVAPALVASMHGRARNLLGGAETMASMTGIRLKYVQS
jgi:hypothetical protein